MARLTLISPKLARHYRYFPVPVTTCQIHLIQLNYTTLSFISAFPVTRTTCYRDYILLPKSTFHLHQRWTLCVVFRIILESLSDEPWMKRSRKACSWSALLFTTPNRRRSFLSFLHMCTSGHFRLHSLLPFVTGKRADLIWATFSGTDLYRTQYKRF